MQFITTDQRIAVENFEIGLIYTITFIGGRYFSGACIGIGKDYVMFQRTAPELIFSLTMETAADVASIEPLGDDIGKILTYTGSVPVSIKTDGTPLLDYLITGNTVQSGTPTPDSPIMPQGIGERTAQLWDISSWDGATTVRGNIEEVENGLRITALSNDAFTYTYGVDNPQCSYKVLSGETYTLSWEVDNPQIYGKVYIFTGTSVADAPLITAVSSSGSKTFTVPSGHNYVAFRLGVSASGDSITYSNIMLNTGSTPLPYEPYGFEISISSAGTTTPVYLGEVQTTRKIRKLVLNGSEPWILSDNIVYINNTDTERLSPLICTHFPNVQNTGMWNGNSRVFQVDISNLGMSGRNAWIAYLQQQYAAGTPVIILYVLVTEETAVVNEPLMRIGDYADTLSYRQSGINVPTTDGLNIFDIDTTVKPSEVYLKYFSPLL